MFTQAPCQPQASVFRQGGLVGAYQYLEAVLLARAIANNERQLLGGVQLVAMLTVAPSQLQAYS